MRVTVITLFCLFILVGCRRDQWKVNRIEGMWSVVYAKLPNFGKIEPDLIFKFDWCKVRYDDFCDISVYDFKSNETEYGLFSVSRNGQSLTMTWEWSGYTEYEIFSIERLNFRTMILRNTNPMSKYFSELRLRSAD